MLMHAQLAETPDGRNMIAADEDGHVVAVRRLHDLETAARAARRMLGPCVQTGPDRWWAGVGTTCPSPAATAGRHRQYAEMLAFWHADLADGRWHATYCATRYGTTTARSMLTVNKVTLYSVVFWRVVRLLAQCPDDMAYARHVACIRTCLIAAGCDARYTA